MISVDKNVWNLLKEAQISSTYKIFLYIALNQPEEGIYGFETTKYQLAEDLNLKIRSIYSGLHWLEREMLIQETKLFETVDFMANPRFVMNNCDFQTRLNEWRRRCRVDIERENRLDEEKRRRRLRKSSKR